ncbi:hypothetical protein O7602_13235 [Micromonospora sp. WMMD1128]|uniref:hypothetical protein n=1 Tax=Micromonospora sp. WMMD1128 TaxID=3015150 RepID=UPI00248B929B|nr:hypothetical protein [Micromonospora sp. WMMD1128]WBB76431.1 hypothetical protein O7602_13235 [Micromonospora sp. WMMD1128]
MTDLTLRRTGRRLWTLTAGTSPRGTLHADRGLVRADATTSEGAWSLRAQGRRRLRITAGPADAPLLELEPPSARWAGMDTPAGWRTTRGFRRYEGVLTRPGGTVTARTSGRPGAPVDVEVTGRHPDLVVLAVCFALLSRRSRDRRIALWSAALSPHGSS